MHTLQHEGVRTTVMKGRKYRGYIDLDETALSMLRHWIELALQYNQTLSASAPKDDAQKATPKKRRAAQTAAPRSKTNDEAQSRRL